MTTTLVEYKTQAGDTIKLTVQDVIRYLVSGKRELVKEQEAIFFIATCKARKLNPFLRECYLIKYSERDPAAIVTSVDYFRKNARRHEDCIGWRCGIIVQKNGELEYREGNLLLDNEKLVGGWAEAQPKDWEIKKRHTVPLKRYIKKTKDGKVTQFWTEEKQPEMISKVAEAQLLRQLWGEEATGMYLHEEVGEQLPQLPIPETPGNLKEQILKKKPEDNAKKDVLSDPTVKENADPWHRSNWINIRSSGFSKYIEDHRESLRQQGEVIKAEVKAKYFRHYGSELTIGEPSSAETEKVEPGADTQPSEQDMEKVERNNIIEVCDEKFTPDQIKTAQQALNFAAGRWPTTLDGCVALRDKLTELYNNKM